MARLSLRASTRHFPFMFLFLYTWALSLFVLFPSCCPDAYINANLLLSYIDTTYYLVNFV